MVNKVIEEGGFKYFKCRKCGKVKPLTPLYFYRNSALLTGYTSKCRECVREENKTIYKPKNKPITKAELEEENKNLKKELELVRKNTRANVETLDNMYGENVDLKKENGELQRENDKLKTHIEAKDKAYMDLLADYNYLKARIKKTERAFIKYKEKLEKLEVDLDMVVMNR